MWTSPDESPRSARRRAIFVAIVALIKSFRRRANLVPIVALILGGVLAYQAVSSEITGKTSRGVGRSGAWRRNEVFTREDSPSKFREATNFLWGLSGFCLIVSVVSFRYYRKIDAYSDG